MVSWRKWVLEERIFFRVHKNFLLPVIDGIDR